MSSLSRAVCGTPHLRPGGLRARRAVTPVRRAPAELTGRARRHLARRPAHRRPDPQPELRRLRRLRPDRGHRVRAAGHRRTRGRRCARRAHALSQNVGAYTGDRSATGARTPDRPPSCWCSPRRPAATRRSFGGVNLVQRLNGLVTKSGPAKGRIADHSHVRRLRQHHRPDPGRARPHRRQERARPAPAAAVPARAAVQARATSGSNFAKPKAPHQGCGAKEPRRPRRHVVRRGPAVADQQGQADAPRGTEGRGRRGWPPSSARAVPSSAAPAPPRPNTNSTGLAAWALGLHRSLQCCEGRRDLGRRLPAGRAADRLGAGRRSGAPSPTTRPVSRPAGRTASPPRPRTSGAAPPRRPRPGCCSGTAAERRCCVTSYASPPRSS